MILFPIGLGGMPLSILNRPSEKEAIDIIIRFVEMGGNFIDTADVYGLDADDAGHNERLILRALKQCGAVAQVMVATKGGATRPNNGWSFRGGGSPQHLRQTCETSLRRLEKEAHDLYYLHGPDPLVPLEDSLGELIRLKEEGKIKQLGVANVDFAELTKATHLTPIAAVQNRCNPFCKGDFNNGVFEFCKKNKILYVPYCPLGGWADHAALAGSESFAALTSKYGVSSYVICLAWLLSHGDNLLPIPGMDKLSQVTENLSAMRLRLEATDIAALHRFVDVQYPKYAG